MKDRIPTKPNRYAVYDDAHNFIRYEYHERADEPTQEGSAINKANLLPDEVATTLGLTGNPQVKDALTTLGRFHGRLGDDYIWSKNTTTPNYTTTTPGTIVLIGQNEDRTVYYSDNFSVNMSNEFVLVNPQSVTLPNDSSVSHVLLGKYVKTATLGNVKMAYIPSNAVITVNTQYNYVTASTGTMYSDPGLIYSVVGYVNSPSPVAYPPSAPDGYAYVSLGKIGSKSRIATGSYTGTGTYGSSSPNTLTFPFSPKLVIIKSKTRTTSSTYSTIGFFVYNAKHGISTLAQTDGNSGTITIYPTWGNNSLTWYSTTNADYQLNATYTNGGTTYYCAYEYVALG